MPEDKRIERRCQCRNLVSILCDREMTAEDLLCDTCREGCSEGLYFGSIIDPRTEVVGTHYKKNSIVVSFDGACIS